MTSIRRWTEGDAIISKDERYRYFLWRKWDDESPNVCYIMLNPSTADGTSDDPTIRRCIYWARRWGCGSISVVNIYALRSTNPAVLKMDVDPIGPLNDQIIASAAASTRRSGGWVVCAWGSNAHGSDRVHDVLKRLEELDVPLHALAFSKYGTPSHPLARTKFKADSGPFPFRYHSSRRRYFDDAEGV